jgi:hypothetical protein
VGVVGGAEVALPDELLETPDKETNKLAASILSASASSLTTAVAAD